MAYYDGRLILPDDLPIDNATVFEMHIDHLVSRDWVAHSKPPFAGPEEAVRYIGRYTHRIAVSNQRILSTEDGLIRFVYKDNKEKDKDKLQKEMTLPADQFITRFLWHVPPKGYHRIRHYGFLNNGQKYACLRTQGRRRLRACVFIFRPCAAELSIMVRHEVVLLAVWSNLAIASKPGILIPVP